MSTTITVHLPHEIIEQLDTLAEETGLTTEELIKVAVERWLDANAESCAETDES